VTNSATVNVSGLEVGASWEYSLDGTNWTSGGGTAFSLTAGTNSYRVRQTDAAGNTGSTSPTVTYTLDTTSPTITLVASDWGIELLSNEDDYVSAVTVVTTGVETGQPIYITLNEQTFGGQVFGNKAVILVSAKALQELTNGAAYTIRVDAQDKAGNTVDNQSAIDTSRISVRRPS
jgi:hypothetical protein